MITAHQADWAAAAKCRGTGDVLFAQGAAQRRVRVLCDGCPVQRECLAEALDDRIEWGVWGGMTERERRHLLRTRPEVTSWRAILLQEASSGR
jgi:WhiB family transcriptional regulator, redox-sensing transcriptional regulator